MKSTPLISLFSQAFREVDQEKLVNISNHMSLVFLIIIKYQLVLIIVTRFCNCIFDGNTNLRNSTKDKTLFFKPPGGFYFMNNSYNMIQTIRNIMR